MLADGAVITVADSLDGVVIWLSRLGDDQPLHFTARFDPTMVRQWTTAATRLLVGEDTISATLPDLDGGRLVVLPQLSGRWILAYQGHPDSTWGNDEIDVGTLETLLDAWSKAADRSRWVPDSLRWPPGPVFNIVALDETPRRLFGSQPRYPDRLREEGIGGTVWVSFVINAAGRVEAPSLAVLYSDERRFNWEARRMLLQSRYSEPTRGDQPVRVRVFQMISFNVQQMW
jgi:TonB family protein